MSVKGLCHICGAPASALCRICNEPTCEIHLSKNGRVCIQCQEKFGGLVFNA